MSRARGGGGPVIVARQFHVETRRYRMIRYSASASCIYHTFILGV